MLGRWKQGVVGFVAGALVIAALGFGLAARSVWRKVDVLWDWYERVQQLTKIQQAMQQTPLQLRPATPEQQPAPGPAKGTDEKKPDNKKLAEKAK